MGSKRKSSSSINESTQGKKTKHSGFWAKGLLAAMNDPEHVIESDDFVTVIKDKYPKAEFHYLVLPKEDIHSLKNVSNSHLQLLKHMEKTAQKIIVKETHKNRQFKIGFHAEPSMARLHLHVISKDFNSPCLKTKKHWNSFTTKFFLDSADVCKELEEKGVIKLPSPEDCKKWLNQSLKCHECDGLFKNIPILKKHILKHIK